MCLSKIKMYMINPQKAFEQEKKTGLGESIKYLLALLVVYSVLSGIIAFFSPQALPPMFLPISPVGFNILLIIIIYIIFFASFDIAAQLQHIFVYAFGGRKGIEQTMKASFYSLTPFLLFGWIPYITIVFYIWSIVLTVIGLKKLHNMPTGRAIAAVLVPLAIIIIIIIALFAWLYPFGFGIPQFPQY